MGIIGLDREGNHQVFYKNTIWQYALQILKYLFPLVLIPYLTRVLGPNTYAVYAYVYAFMGVMQVIADFGFTLSGTKRVIEYCDNRLALNKLVSEITVARIFLILILYIMTTMISFFIPIMYENYLYVMLSFIAVALRALLPDFVFQGHEHMGPLTTRYFASKGMQIILTLFLVHNSSDLLLVAFADIIGSLVGLIWSFLAMKRLFLIQLSKPSISGSLNELQQSAIYCISNVSSSLLSGFTTIIVGIAIKDSLEIAYWTLALTTVNAVQALYIPITNSLYPHMIKSKDFQFARRLAIIAAPVLAFGIAAYILLSEPIILLLGGEEYIGAARVMCMLAPVLAFSFYVSFIGWPILGSMGYVGKLTATTVFTGIINMAILSAMTLAGITTLEALCLVRCMADALLLTVRVIVLIRINRRNHNED